MMGAFGHPAVVAAVRRVREPEGAMAASRRIAIAALVGALLLPVRAPASAQTIRPRPEPLDCTAATAEFGQAATWFGVFAGRRKTTFDWIETTSVTACFRTEKDCFNWLYWMQTDWPDWTFRIGCAKGQIPNGDPKWWSQRLGG